VMRVLVQVSRAIDLRHFQYCRAVLSASKTR